MYYEEAKELVAQRAKIQSDINEHLVRIFDKTVDLTVRVRLGNERVHEGTELQDPEMNSKEWTKR
jgi:hypothetical protein